MKIIGISLHTNKQEVNKSINRIHLNKPNSIFVHKQRPRWGYLFIDAQENKGKFSVTIATLKHEAGWPSLKL